MTLPLSLGLLGAFDTPSLDRTVFTKGRGAQRANSLPTNGVASLVQDHYENF
jgi:hypothetical protein